MGSPWENKEQQIFAIYLLSKTVFFTIFGTTSKYDELLILKCMYTCFRIGADFFFFYQPKTLTYPNFTIHQEVLKD